MGAGHVLMDFGGSHAPILAYHTNFVIGDHSGKFAVCHMYVLDFVILGLLRFLLRAKHCAVATTVVISGWVPVLAV